MKIDKILTVFLLILFYQSAFGTIINIPGDYPTIQQGIDASYDGDTVLVKPGEYVENLVINNQELVLGSYFLTTGDTSYIPITIIDGDSVGRVIRITDVDRAAAIIGFTIQNGYSGSGGAGIACSFSTNLRISHNIIKDNYVSLYSGDNGGGGISCYVADPIISNNLIINNVIPGGFSSGYGGGICCIFANPIIKNNTIAGNFSCWGGGISLYNYSCPIIQNNIIWENTAEP
jgi:hypothetical protein